MSSSENASKLKDRDGPISRVVGPVDSAYPQSVSRAYPKATPALTLMGNEALLDRKGIGFCGSRKASEKGLQTTQDCAEQAAKADFVVVSGNAAGVDLITHKAALDAGGATILVLPEGMDHFRIKKNLRGSWDWSRILVVSQFPTNAVWRSQYAMARNKMIAVLSKAMIVIEAGENGGTLNAGMTTLNLGKPLFVAEYSDMPLTAPGNEKLIKGGGISLKRSRETLRANMGGVFERANNDIARRRILSDMEIQPALI